MRCGCEMPKKSTETIIVKAINVANAMLLVISLANCLRSFCLSESCSGLAFSVVFRVSAKRFSSSAAVIERDVTRVVVRGVGIIPYLNTRMRAGIKGNIKNVT